MKKHEKIQIQKRKKEGTKALKYMDKEGKEDTKEKNSVSLGTVLKRGIPILFSALPKRYMAADLFLVVTHSLSLAANVTTQQLFFDAAAEMAGGKGRFETALLFLVLMIGVSALSQVLNGLGNFYPAYVLWPRYERKIKTLIFRKASRLPASDFEDTEKLDAINKAVEGGLGVINTICTILNIFDFYLIYFLYIGWYLFTLKPVLSLSILLVFLPTAVSQVIRSQAFAKAENETAPLRREYEHYENCLAGREFFKETRILGGFSYFKKLYLDTLKAMQKIQYKTTMKTNRTELLMRFCTVLGYSGILLMLFDALMKREISVGAFAAVFNSIGMLYGIMEEIICRHIGTVSKQMGAVKNYFRFLDLPEREQREDSEKGKEETRETEKEKKNAAGWGDVVLEHVSFSYPHAEKRALEDVSFTLKKGETIAIVGENGSGKSTLVRLLSGLYTPEEGRVLHNGIDLRDRAGETVFSGISAVFQNFQRYQATLEDNLLLGAPSEAGGGPAYDRACQTAGLEGYPKEGEPTEKFPQEYKTMLSREFGGVELSGGQWQRVAIARGFFRPHNMILLDEPTAAIDPYEETRLYNQFAEISRGKSAVIVTHRLGSVKLADRILVLKQGRLVQEGSHEELLAVEGEYKRLYEAQEQWYNVR